MFARQILLKCITFTTRTDCGDFNYAKRFQTANVKGQVAVITGSRLKNRLSYYTDVASWWSNGYTHRFPWILHCVLGKNLILWIGDRLKIHGLDLRHIPSVEIFCNFIEQKIRAV
jgi:hypothetical protein